MKPLRKFDSYIFSGVVRKQQPDTKRIKSLQEESTNRAEYVKKVSKKLGVNKSTANFIIESCYDALISLARARMMEKGYYARGEGAHEAEVSFLREIGLPENEVFFLNELRQRRNRILYYGDKNDAEYAKLCIQKMALLQPKLLKRS